MLRRFGVWQTGVGVLMTLGVLTSATWLTSLSPPPSAWAVATASIGLAVVLRLSWQLLQFAPLSLRWDGAAWHLGPAASAGEEPWTGSLVIAIDFGRWMLLRFVPDAPHRHAAPTWLPVQRRGLEAPWHALRCAVYSPRPPPGPDAPADS